MKQTPCSVCKTCKASESCIISYGIHRFITVFAIARHWLWRKLIQFTCFHPIYLKFILISAQVFQAIIYIQVSRPKFWCTYLLPLCVLHTLSIFIFLGFNKLKYAEEGKMWGISLWGISLRFLYPLSLPPTYTEYSRRNPILKHLNMSLP